MSAFTPAALLTPAAVEALPPAARAVLPYLSAVWLRPEQRIETAGLRELGCLAGRGWGKTTALACVVVDHVLALGAIKIGLMAPTEERAKAVMIHALIEASPPWCKPWPRGDRLTWPQGAEALIFTAQEPGRTRGGNFHLFWFSELVDWPLRARREAWAIAAAATRKGPELLLWDTTARGTNELIDERLRNSERDPTQFRVLRGTTYQNPMLTPKYRRSITAQFAGQRRAEELLGEIFDHAAGAHWGRTEIATRRVSPAAVPGLMIKIWAHDPAFSSEPGADETGLVGGGRAADGAVYILADASGANDAEAWAATIVDGIVYDDYAGVVTETNRGGKMARMVLNAECSKRSPPLRIKLLRDDQPFAPRIFGVLQLKELNTKNSKMVRGEGARVFGNVRHAGTFEELEDELTTYDGTGPSPNRFDAFNYLVNELADLGREVKAPPALIGYGALVDGLRGTGTRRAI